MGALSTKADTYDVIVVGAGYGGLISAAILARKGMKTLVVNEIDQVGGRGGAYNYNGYWLDVMARDATDLGDSYLLVTKNGQYGLKAAEAAGADIAFVGPIEPMLTVHMTPGNQPIELSKDPSSAELFAQRVYGLSDEHTSRFLQMLENLAAEEPSTLIETTFDEWSANLAPEMREGLRRMSKIIHPLPPGEASIGRFIQYLRDPTTTYLCNDAEVGGMQGFMESYARAIRNHGGKIENNLQALELVVKDGSAKGVITLDKANGVRVFEAPVVVFAQPVWNLLKLLPEDALPAEFVDNAEKLQTYCGDWMALHIGLSGLPTIRETGRLEDTPIFNRILRDGGYWGGFWIPSTVSKKQAPPGKHLLEVAFATAGPGHVGWEPFKSFEDAKATIDYSLGYMREYYKDLDEVTEWMTYNLSKGPTCCVLWAPVARAPLQCPTVDGLYLVDCTTEVDGQEMDIAANAALQSTKLILERHFQTK